MELTKYHSMTATPSLTPIQQSDLEYSGRLTAATADGALFSLLLALHYRPANEYLTSPKESDEAVTDPHFPARLNHYRRPKLNGDESSISTSYHNSGLLHQGKLVDLSLQQAMHPDVLGYKPEGMTLGEEVIANCDYATQCRIKQERQLDNTLPLDYTHLANIIPEATQML